MIRKLLAFSGIAVVASIACLAGAAYLTRHDYGTWTISNEGHVSHFNRTKAQPTADTPAATKALAWTGGNRLEVNLPGEVEFTQGDKASVSVTGPAFLIERVHLDGGRLWLADGPDGEHMASFTIDREGFHARDDDDRLHVSITAPNVSVFEMSGMSGVKLRNIDLPLIDLSLTGVSSVTADGHAAKLKLDISGNGDADLRDLIANDADINISGSGRADINAKDKAQVDVSGAGDVNFTGRPAVVNSNITGSGSVE